MRVDEYYFTKIAPRIMWPEPDRLVNKHGSLGRKEKQLTRGGHLRKWLVSQEARPSYGSFSAMLVPGRLEP